jgi:hypothetical protein
MPILFFFITVTLLPVSPAFSQTEAPRVSAGVLTGILGRHGEERFVGTSGILGGWADVALRRWAVEIDVARSQLFSERHVSCPYPICDENDPTRKAAIGVRSERNWTLGVSGVRRFQLSGPVVPHFLIGLGLIRRNSSFIFDNPEFGLSARTRLGWGPAAGVGIDALIGNLILRSQYRFQPAMCCLGGFAVAQQIRAGVGWRF